MTDVIFLLLIFFMVTSTFVFPTGLEVNLPQSTEQSSIKPGTRVYIDAEQQLFASMGEEDPQPLDMQALIPFLNLVQTQDSLGFVAIYADETVPYGKIVEVLNAGAANNIKMVLATKPVSGSPAPAEAQPAQGGTPHPAGTLPAAAPVAATPVTNPVAAKK